MPIRYTEIKPLDRCLSPITVWKNGVKYRVRCGRCVACRLDKSNDWSMRLRDEIEHTPLSLFFTLTYNNKYLPKLKVISDNDGILVYSSVHNSNVRFNSVRDVLRSDDIRLELSSRFVVPSIQNFSSDGYFAYASKRDIQLWLKSIRASIFNEFNLLDKDDCTKESYKFRYYIISEYGPTTYRPHYHGLFFFRRHDVAEFVRTISMFSNWKMCNKALFDEHTHYCDSGASEYVTNYVCGNLRLPQIFTSPELKPFRLASKNPSIGFVQFDKEKIYEDVASGNIEFIKVVNRIESEYVFCYPAQYMRRLFPKCREFSLLSYQRLRFIYGRIFTSVVCRRYKYETVLNFLRAKYFPADYTCAKKCYDFCLEFGATPDFYLYLLDMYYYKEQMFALRKFYEWQELNHQRPLDIMCSYINFQELCMVYLSSRSSRLTLDMFCAQFGLDAFQIASDVSKVDFVYGLSEKSLFIKQVDDIVTNSLKMPKFNEKFNFNPHIV